MYHLGVEEKHLICVTHDECTYYANCKQYFRAVLWQKSLGASIMVSDFIHEVAVSLRHDREEVRGLL